MELLKVADPVSVNMRRRHRLHRRIYASKVSEDTSCSTMAIMEHFRGQIIAGTSMETTNLNNMAFMFMAALMGKI